MAESLNESYRGASLNLNMVVQNQLVSSFGNTVAYSRGEECVKGTRELKIYIKGRFFS